MADIAQDRRSLPPDAKPDRRFGLAVGLYVTALIAPSVAAVAWVLLEWSTGRVFLTLLSSTAIVLAVTMLVTTRVSRFAVRLGTTAWRWGLVVVPGGFLVGTMVVDPTFFIDSQLSVSLFPVDSPGVLAHSVPHLAVFITAIGGLTVGFLVAVMSRTRYTAAVAGGKTVDGEWKARPTPNRRRQILLSAVTLVTVGTAAFVFGVQAFHAAGQMMIAASGGVLAMRTSKRYRVSAAGLELYGPKFRTLIPWENCTSYTVTDEAIVVHRRWPRPSVGFDRHDIDSDTVVEALAPYLKEK